MSEGVRVLAGRYELVEKLPGEGAEGVVWRARCIASAEGSLAKPGDVVAIKVLRHGPGEDDTDRRFQRHVNILRSLDHPNIVRYLDSVDGSWDERQCVVMEFLEGQDLSQAFKKLPDKGLRWEDTQRIFSQVLAGLVHAHARHVTHRDIKPANIFDCTSGAVKLVDFGIARLTTQLTVSNVGIQGTFDYMAPEFARVHHCQGSEQTDIFSFGVCLYEAIVGVVPFLPPVKGDAQQFFQRWMSPHEPKVAFKHPAFKVVLHLREYVNRCIAVDPANRFKTFAEAAAAFRRLHRPVITGADGEQYELTEWIRSGGFGDVFKGSRLSDGVAVAVKKLISAKNAPERFLREANILRQHPHEHLVEYIGFIESDDPLLGQQLSLVIEYLEGMPGFSLRDRISVAKRHGSGLDVEEVLQVFQHYLEALHHLHEQRIIHRDIKPSNLYAPPGKPEQAKIFDLGVARNELGTFTGLAGGIPPGTYDYMAPELARAGKDRGSPESDVFSIGLCFYEALTGVPVFEPFKGNGQQAMEHFIARANTRPRLSFDFDAFRRLSVLKDVVQKALHPKPNGRYRSAEEMRKALEAAYTVLTTPDEVEEPETQDIASASSISRSTRSRREAALAGHTGAVVRQTKEVAPDPETILVPHPRLVQETVIAPATAVVSKAVVDAHLAVPSRRVHSARPWIPRIKSAAQVTVRVFKLTAKVAAALLGVASLGALGWGAMVGLQRLALGRVEPYLLAEPVTRVEYMDGLISAKNALKMAPKWPRNKQLDQKYEALAARFKALPALFTNALSEANNLGDISGCEALSNVWMRVSPGTVDPKQHRAVVNQIEEVVKRLTFDRDWTALTNTIPASVTAGDLKDAETKCRRLAEFRSRTWPGAAANRKTDLIAAAENRFRTAFTIYVDTLRQASDDSAYTQLKQAGASNYPCLNGLVGNKVAVAVAAADRSREARTFGQRVAFLQAEAGGIVSLVDVERIVTDFANLSKANPSDPAVLDCRRAISNAVFGVFSNEVVAVVALYNEDKLDRGVQRFRTLEGVLAKVKKDAGWSLDGVMKPVRDAESGARDRLAKEQKRLADERQRLADEQKQREKARLDAIEKSKQLQAQQKAERDGKIADTKTKFDGYLKQAHSQSADANVILATLQNLATVNQEDREGLVLATPELLSARNEIVAACSNALLRIIKERDPLIGRAARLTTIGEKILGNKELRSILGKVVDLIESRYGEEVDKSILEIRNQSGQTALVGGPSGLHVTLAAGASTNHIVSCREQSGPAEIQVKAVVTGYATAMTNVTITRGGYTHVVLRDFRPLPIRVKLAKMDYGENDPTCTVRYERDGAVASPAPWPDGELLLLPGTYVVVFNRDDYRPVTNRFEVKLGDSEQTVALPSKTAWTAGPQLMRLMAMRAAIRDAKTSGNGAELRREFDAASKLQNGGLVWHGHVTEYNNLITDYNNLLKQWTEVTRKRVTDAINSAERGVALWRAFLYQCSDPSSINKYRLGNRDAVPSPVVLDTKISADVESAGLGALEKGAVRRLKLWHKYTVEGLEGREKRESMAVELDSLAIDKSMGPTAGQCRFEVALLRGAVDAASTLTEINEVQRWRAHAAMNQNSSVPKPDILEHLAGYAETGGITDRYDVLLALYEANLCWRNVISSVQMAAGDPKVVGKLMHDEKESKKVSEWSPDVVRQRDNLAAVLEALDKSAAAPSFLKTRMADGQDYDLLRFLAGDAKVDADLYRLLRDVGVEERPPTGEDVEALRILQELLKRGQTP